MFSDSEEFDLFKIKHNSIAPTKGKVLISVPFVRDINFQKSVILLTEHDAGGSFGFILNKEFGYKLSEVITDIEECDLMVGYGGPVESDTLHFIHTLGDIIPDSARVAGNLFWGGDMGTVKTLINQGQIGKDQIRFFIGYTGWSPHQLHDEILADSWLVSQLSGKDIMHYTNEYLWKLSLFKMGPKYSYWTSFPDNPSLN